MSKRRQRIRIALPEAQAAAEAGQPLPLSAADVRWVGLGTVVGCHGLHGELKVKQYNPDSELLLALEQIVLRSDRGLHVYALRGVRAGSKGPLLMLAGVDTLEAAQALRGAEVCVPRDTLPDPAHGEFYYVDLEGLEVTLPDGTGVGRVERVCEYPASRALRVRAAAQIWEVPMLEPYLVSIDLEAKRVVVDHLDDLEPERVR